jgi:hypothetical protein
MRFEGVKIRLTSGIPFADFQKMFDRAQDGSKIPQIERPLRSL